MRGFWQGLMLGGLAGIIVGFMAAPRLEEELDVPLRKRSAQLSSMAHRALQGVQEHVGEMWERRVKE